MEFRKCVWMPLCGAGDEDDQDTPKKLDTACMAPANFNEEEFDSARRQPEVFNQRMAQSLQPDNEIHITVSPPTPTDPSVPSEAGPSQAGPSEAGPSQVGPSRPAQAAPTLLAPTSLAPPQQRESQDQQPGQAEAQGQLVPYAAGQPQQMPNAQTQLMPFGVGQPQQMGPYQNAGPVQQFIPYQPYTVPADTFYPMRAAVQAPQPPPMYIPHPAGQGGLVPFDTLLRVAAGFSPNYQGNIFVEANRSANIPDILNCSVFITGLSPDVTVRTLLRGIRQIGRIYACHINTPEPTRGHLTCAGKISFFDRPSAARFMRLFGFDGLRLPDHPGFVGTVVWNRVKTAPVAKPADHTRVLLIAGPGELVNPVWLHGFFSSKLVYDVDDVIDRGPVPDGVTRLVEFRFGSYRCQAESARMALQREYGAVIDVAFGMDPCAQ